MARPFAAAPAGVSAAPAVLTTNGVLGWRTKGQLPLTLERTAEDGPSCSRGGFIGPPAVAQEWFDLESLVQQRLKAVTRLFAAHLDERPARWRSASCA